MRRLFLSVLCLLAALSCVREIEPPQTARQPFPEGEPVTVTFSVPGVNTTPATRAESYLPLGEEIDLQSLHLAVFGSSGYLKEYVPATLKEQTETDGVVIFTYTARLTLSESKRTIHFIGNGDDQMLFDDAKAVLPPMVTPEGHQGFWQMVELPGIFAQMDEDGYYVDEDGHRNTAPDFKGYVVDDATNNLLKNIPLVRNWAKLQVVAEDDANFVPYSYTFVNIPSRGTIVPYSTNPTFLSHNNNSGFIKNYNSYEFGELRDFGYESNLPAGVTFNDVVPDAEYFQWAFSTGRESNGVVPVDAIHAIYLYERCVPSDEIPPSYVIVYGKYKDPENTDASYEGDLCYYKIDLMDDDGYYPIFRNFCYRIIIRSVLRKGQATPAEAASSAGSADVSADITTQHISEVSDGFARLAIDPWMSHTFIEEIDQEDDPVLYAKLVVDDVHAVPGLFSAVVVPLPDGSSDIIRNVSFDYEHEQEGWVPVRFELKRPRDSENQILDATKTQTLRIIGNYAIVDENLDTHETVTTNRRLYREVIITLQKRQDMRVRCQNQNVLAKIGEPQAVDIWIPDGLVSSMFPLDFTIEAEKATLSPDLTPGRRPMPVRSGTSISDDPEYQGKQTFQYTCTLTWSDYLSLVPQRILDADGSEHVWRIFTCHFITTRELSATNIYVQNEYFVKTSASFVNADPPEKFNYFYVAASNHCYLKINRSVSIYYCHKFKSRGETIRSGWDLYTNNVPIELYANDTVWFKANELTWDESSAPSGETKFNCYVDPDRPDVANGSFNVGGNIASLLVGDAFEESGPTVTGYSFNNFFKNHTGLVDASKLELPMLAASGSCYKSMFEGCTSLTNAPELPATTLAASCYHGMFKGCTALTEAPVLPAETLVSNCYFEMFKGCSNLLSVTCLATSGINTDGSTTDWLDGVPNTEVRHGTFTINPAAHVRGDREGSGNTWPMSFHGIPTYWMITNGLVPVFPVNPFDDQVDF